MFHTEISKVHIDEEYSWIDFLSAISKFEVNKLAYLTKKKLPYPDKSLVLYMYMNPTFIVLSVNIFINPIENFH